MKKRTSTTGAEALFLGAFTYALTGILVREVSAMWGDNAQVVVRYALVFIILALYGVVRKKKTTVPRSQLPIAVILAISFALMVQLFTYAIGKTTIANTLFTFYAINLVASFLLGTFWLHEKVSSNKIVAIVFAIAGLSVYANALIGRNIGLIYAIGAGLAAGVANVCSKLLSGIDRNAVLKIQYGVGTIFSAALMVLSGERIVRHASLHNSILTIIFVFVILAGGNLVLFGYQHFDVNIATVIMSTELIWAAVMAYLLFHEVPAPHELVGGALIFTGSVLGMLIPKS
jgi:drug/metabolite transporter (DMT)-like permease